MTDKEKLDNLVAEIERRISRNKRNKVFEDVPEKRHQLIIEGQLLGELKHFIDSMQEEPICAFRTNRYTNEDRKVLCEGCEEECEYNKKEGPVSDDLEEEITDYINNHFSECEDGVLLSDAHNSELQYTDVADIARHFANWQKQYMMKDAMNGLVYAQRTNGEMMFRSNYVKKEGFEFGDKVKVIVIKKD